MHLTFDDPFVLVSYEDNILSINENYGGADGSPDDRFSFTAPFLAMYLMCPPLL
jgi:hypothetical protein